MKFLEDPHKKNSLGSVEIVVLGAVFLMLIFALGFFNDSPPVYKGIKYLPIDTTPLPSQSSLQMQSMQFISIVQTPTPILTGTPTPTPSGSPATTTTPTSAVTPPTSSTSLLCGTNLGLFFDNDWVANPGAQASLANLHVPTLRMPLRVTNDPTGTRLVKSVQIAHSLGVIPLVTLPSETTYLALDKNVIQQINAIMGGSQIYYELGNEVFDANYLGKWNAIIPQLKPIAVNAWFGGPAAGSNDGLGTNPQTVRIANFYISAHPTPDFVSWHEYTCGNIIPGTPNYDPKNTTNYCFDHVANSLGGAAGHNWTQHMQDQQAAFRTVGITTMPKIFITEWGYDSVPLGGSTPDPRLAQLSAMHFTAEALKELKNIGVYAAYQYVLNTNKDVNLVNFNGSPITPYGQDFQSFCQNP